MNKAMLMTHLGLLQAEVEQELDAILKVGPLGWRAWIECNNFPIDPIRIESTGGHTVNDKALYETMLMSQKVEVSPHYLIISAIREDTFAGVSMRVVGTVDALHPEEYRQALKDCGSLVSVRVPPAKPVTYETIACHT